MSSWVPRAVWLGFRKTVSTRSRRFDTLQHCFPVNPTEAAIWEAGRQLLRGHEGVRDLSDAPLSLWGTIQKMIESVVHSNRLVTYRPNGMARDHRVPRMRGVMRAGRARRFVGSPNFAWTSAYIVFSRASNKPAALERFWVLSVSLDACGSVIQPNKRWREPMFQVVPLNTTIKELSDYRARRSLMLRIASAMDKETRIARTESASIRADEVMDHLYRIGLVYKGDVGTPCLPTFRVERHLTAPTGPIKAYYTVDLSRLVEGTDVWCGDPDLSCYVQPRHTRLLYPRMQNLTGRVMPIRPWSELTDTLSSGWHRVTQVSEWDAQGTQIAQYSSTWVRAL